ncbi:Diaminobutyrate--2-oxoglutarate transaminase [Labrenzia sp. THAF82]|uniref:diaminobutyrate--2-oxoglutarate transaminase n=1 Tax=Labrenzia sp. THAF82 TaxID=2587861 RepID=UPI0012A9A3C1|nr:diaminobutyrate--2-oxoglutarate transaminase [Labrenzia sp. THAF82]QFT33919.1 Diaminobutyrate--2-oxoglutarate transaminase [Labrenzia sp. THAF82]
METKVFEECESQVRTYFRQFPMEFNKAEGSYIFGADGRCYIDFLSGAGSLNYGHNNPAIRKALIAYLNEGGIVHSLDLHTTAKKTFMRTFVDKILAPRGMEDYKLQFVGPTGTNAVEAALKLARKVTGAHDIFAFTHGFHGVTLGALATCGEQSKRAVGGVPLSNVTRVPFDGFHSNLDTIALIEQMLADPNSGWVAPAAFIVEVVQGEGGLNVASPSWLKALEQLCRKLGSLLIVDEVQTGCGRTGDFFAFEASGICPDIVCVSKSIGGYGLPMALVLLRRELDCWRPGEHNGTFRGSCLSFIAATSAIETYWSDTTFIEDVRK